MTASTSSSSTASARQGSSHPVLHHTISHDDSSVLAIAVDRAKNLLFSSGSQSECIYVWSLSSYRPVARLTGHSASVLALEIAPDKNWLFSAGGDGTIRIWDTKTFACLFVVQQPQSEQEDPTLGDIFSIKWSPQLQTLYVGCQNTSIRWIRLSRLRHSGGSNNDAENGAADSLAESGYLPASAIPITPPQHKFFDSAPGPSRMGRSNSAVLQSGSTTPTFDNAFTPPTRFASGFQTPDISFTGAKPHAGMPMSPEPRTSSELFGNAFGKSLLSQQAPNATESEHSDGPGYVQLPGPCKIPNAHYGYVYTLELLRLSNQQPVALVSGSGDEDIKVWKCDIDKKGHLELMTTLTGADGAVLSLASWSGTLFAGKQGGDVEVWDLETFSLIKTLCGHDDDVLSLSVVDSEANRILLTTGADGRVNCYDENFNLKDSWTAHSNAFAPASALLDNASLAITGGSDSMLRIWDVRSLATTWSAATEPELSRRHGFSSLTYDADGAVTTTTSFDSLLVELARFIAHRSVSDDMYREECRQCAHYLKSTLMSMGAHESFVVPGKSGRNPLVLSTFRARGPQGIVKPRRRVLFYGHYDVIAAQNDMQWQSSPWKLSGRNGYLYGRGATDNKGPILAVASAVSRLWTTRNLDVDVVMLIEGEEESGSVGFQTALERERERIGDIDVILLSNSYWIDDTTPCLTMGMRGVIQAKIVISAAGGEDLAVGGNARNGGCTLDVHSGVQGGAVREPMIDMLRLLASLSNGDKVQLPHFYDKVRPVSEEERQRYQQIVDILENQPDKMARPENGSVRSDTPSVEGLMARWRHPTLSVHSVSVSGSGNSTVIPAVVTARVSLRLVPDQALEVIQSSLISFLSARFAELTSHDASTPSNRLEVHIQHSADWWLGSSSSPYILALSSSIADTWCRAPIQIREGGSIPTVALLEKTLGAPAVHLPMGQSSDNAHLGDERISLEHLQKGRTVVETWLGKIGKLGI